MSDVTAYTGHDLHVLPGTDYVHCRSCGGSGSPGKPNSLTSECSGSPNSSEYLNRIFEKRLDYRRGKWVTKNARA